jgi:hypothetical protein
MPGSVQRAYAQCSQYESFMLHDLSDSGGPYLRQPCLNSQLKAGRQVARVQNMTHKAGKHSCNYKALEHHGKVTKDWQSK